MTSVPPCLGCGAAGPEVASSSAAGSSSLAAGASSLAAGASSLAAGASSLAAVELLSLLLESLSPHAAENNDNAARSVTIFIHR